MTLTMTLRPFISVVSHSLSSVFLLLVLYLLIYQPFHMYNFVSFSISSSPYIRFFSSRHEDVSSWLAGGNVTVSCI